MTLVGIAMLAEQNRRYHRRALSPVRDADLAGRQGLAIILLGATPLAVLVFEIVPNATSLFNHANIVIPIWVDGILRRVVVPPDMHRMHHSVIRRETDSNFGFNLPWRDRLFGTCRDQPEAGHTSIIIGLSEFRGRRPVGVHWLPVQPFINDGGAPAAASRSKSVTTRCMQ